MKKYLIFLVFTIMLLSIFLNVENVNACSCVYYLPIEKVISDEDNLVFSGEVIDVKSKTKVIIKVLNNYSQENMNQYIIVSTNSSIAASCGIDFSKYENKILFIVGDKNTNDIISTTSCSFREVNDNKINNIKFNDTSYDEFDLENINEYINSEPLIENSMPTINNISTYILISSGVLIFVAIIIVIYIYRRKKTKK